MAQCSGRRRRYRCLARIRKAAKRLFRTQGSGSKRAGAHSSSCLTGLSMETPKGSLRRTRLGKSGNAWPFSIWSHLTGDVRQPASSSWGKLSGWRAGAVVFVEVHVVPPFTATYNHTGVRGKMQTPCGRPCNCGLQIIEKQGFVAERKVSCILSLICVRMVIERDRKSDNMELYESEIVS